MAAITEVVADAVEVLDQKVAAVQGVPPRIKPPVIPPINQGTVPNAHFTYLANLIRPLIGFPTLNPNVGLSLDGLQDDIAYGIYFIGADVYQLAQVAADGVAAAKAYTDAEVRYVSAVQSGQGAASAAGVLAQAKAWFDQAEANISQVWTAAYNTAINAQHSAEVFAQVAVNNEAATRSSQITGLSTSLDQKFGKAESDIGAVLSAAVGSALNAQHSAEAYAKSLHDIAESDISTVWTDAYQTALNVEHNAYTYTDQAVSGLSSSIETKLATQVEPELAKVSTAVDTCLEPLCDTVTPNAKNLGKLGNLLKGLEAVGIAALISGLVAAAVADPQAAADAIDTAGGWVTGAADDLVQGLGS